MSINGKAFKELQAVPPLVVPGRQRAQVFSRATSGVARDYDAPPLEIESSLRSLGRSAPARRKAAQNYTEKA